MVTCHLAGAWHIIYNGGTIFIPGAAARRVIMQPKSIFAFCIIFTALVSCSGSTNGLPSASPTFTSFPIVTNFPPSTPAIAATVQPNLVESIEPKSSLTQYCLTTLESKASIQDIANGTIVLGDLNIPPYLLELKSQAHHDLTYQTKSLTVDRYSFGIEISPNRNNLAYIEVFRDVNGEPQYFKIRVVDSKGKILASRSINSKDINPYWRWVNDETIQIISNKAILDGTVNLYSPFKQEWKEITNKFPGLYQDLYIRPSKLMVDYSPNFEWAIYLADQGDKGFGPIALDLTTDQVIWQAVGKLVTENKPLWSPIGDRVAIIVENRLYIISRDGQVSSPLGLKENDKIEDGKFAWSPNGKYISFWVTRGASARLMLYDTHNEQVFDYCIEDLGLGNSIVWSPDSEQFITNIVAKNADSALAENSILIDVSKNIGYKLSINKPLVWMNSQP